MAAKPDFDKANIREQLAEARERAARNRRSLAEHPDDPKAQDWAYSVYEASLEAAGATRALGEAEANVRELLAAAADAIVEVFRRRGSLTSTITHLPSGEDETFVDTSLTDQWALVHGSYAALAGGNQTALAALGALGPEDYVSEQVEASPLLEQLSAALHAVAGDRIDDANLRAPKGAADEDDRYWIAQLRVLEQIAARSRPGTAQALAELDAELDRYFHGEEYRNDTRRLLKLPLLGLKALAARTP